MFLVSIELMVQRFVFVSAYIMDVLCKKNCFDHAFIKNVLTIDKEVSFRSSFSPRQPVYLLSRRMYLFW